MKHSYFIFSLLLIQFFGCKETKKEVSEGVAKVDSQTDWEASIENSSNLEIKDGYIYPKNDSAFFSTKFVKFDSKQTIDSITFKQSSQWNNWKAVPKLTPEMAEDAPVFIPVKKGDYWFLGRYRGDEKTGYHSWHSTDMKTWKHYGPVTTERNKWVTSAEYVDGKFYIYFDRPNDEDPHLVIDEDLRDGKQGEEIGMVFKDPSHGSDMGIMRDKDGIFHMVYEDWSPLDPSVNSWDSPLAGHSDSPDGITEFEPHEYPAPIDQRTKATGKVIPYTPHPNQLVDKIDSIPYQYNEHEGEQNAYGDYTLIRVGDEYYIFCDYDSDDENKSMRIGRWRSNDIKKEFEWDGEIGEGFHPDPTVGFAEGKFYLLVQRTDKDFISDGPWVDGVEVRVGIDSTNDGKIDKWTEFKKISETYSQNPKFIKVIETTPAVLDASELGEGYGYKVEVRLNQKEGFYPVLDSFETRIAAE